MNPVINPFSPGAGAPPPELVGRENILEEAKILLGRIRLRRSVQGCMLTGLRGVGKTVLLSEVKASVGEKAIGLSNGCRAVLVACSAEVMLFVALAIDSLRYMTWHRGNRLNGPFG